MFTFSVKELKRIRVKTGKILSATSTVSPTSQTPHSPAFVPPLTSTECEADDPANGQDAGVGIVDGRHILTPPENLSLIHI